MINVVGFKIFGSNKIEDNLSGDCFDHYTRIEISELDNRSISECWFLETNETVPFSFSEYMMNKGFIYNELYLNQIENAINENSNIRKLDNYYFIDITSVFKKYNTEKNEDNCYEIELKISSESEIWNIDIATTEVVFIAYNPVLDEFTISSMYEANFEKTTIKSRDIKDLIQAKEAFAVYSEDNQSLNFYKRAEVPSVGGQFDGRTVTEVYTGIENTDYSTPTSAPWSKYYISKAKVIDDGIKPKNINYWFARSHSGGSSARAIDSTEQTIDLSKLDASEIKGALGTFMDNKGVDNVILKNLNFSSDVNMSSMFNKCMLTNIDFSGSNTINIINLNSMFANCDNLISIDISNFNTAKATDMLGTFAFCDRLQKIKLGEKFEWKGTKGYLPAPSSNYIPNADGKWYNSRGQAFAPEEIPNNVADTYYASKDLIPKATMYVGIENIDWTSFYIDKYSYMNYIDIFEHGFKFYGSSYAVNIGDIMTGERFTSTWGYKGIFDPNIADRPFEISFDYLIHTERASSFISKNNIDMIGTNTSGSIRTTFALGDTIEFITIVNEDPFPPDEPVSLYAIEITNIYLHVPIKNDASSPTSLARKITNAYVGTPSSVQLDESNLLSYFETDQLNDFDGSQFALKKYDLSYVGLESVELIAKEDTVISFDYSFYRELSDRIFELYINSELIYSFSNTEYTYKNKWSGRVSKNSSLKIELKLNTDITGEVSVRAPSYVDCVISNIQISTPSMPAVARKIKKAYIGVPTQIPIYEEHETTTIKDVETLITPSNISNFFTRADNSYPFLGDSSGKFTSTNQNAHSTTAKSTWTAKKQIKKLTFSYRVGSESNYDKYSITVGGTIVANNISGNGSNRTYSGSLSSGGAIVLQYSKDGSVSKYDDCGTIWDIKVTTAETVTTTEKVQVGTETKEVARLCYQAPPQ